MTFCLLTREKSFYGHSCMHEPVNNWAICLDMNVVVQRAVAKGSSALGVRHPPTVYQLIRQLALVDFHIC